MPPANFDVGFIGTGSMGSMLVRAFLRNQTVHAENIWLANRTLAKLAALAAEFPGVHRASLEHVARHSEVLFITVKPGDTQQVLRTIARQIRPDQLCVFLTNVFTFEQLEERIPCSIAKLVPTVTQQISQGVALVAYGKRTTPEQVSRLEHLLAPTCKLLKVVESQMRLFGDVTSCGPAFLAVCIDQLCREAAAIDPALPARDLAMCCIETLSATAHLLRTGMTPQQLTGEVAVSGGMTEAGIKAMGKWLPPLLSSVFSATRQAEQKKRETLSLED